MKNAMLYYYDLDPIDIHQKNDTYFFKINNNTFFVYPLLRSDNELNSIYQINMELINKKTPVHQIILNKQKNIVTVINDIPYVVLKSVVKKNDSIDIDDICYLHSKTETKKQDSFLDKSNWVNMWEKKNDYLEYQISQFGIKYPIICETFSYYIGLAENAILYAKNTVLELKPNYLDNMVISHKRINHNTTLFDLYNPLNFIIDYKVRDIAEYIKFKFFYNRNNLWEEINNYFSNYKFSTFGIRLFFARLLYPTYYFDIYDMIIEENSNEKEILKIVKLQEEYEEFLNDIYYFLILKYPLPPIEWLIKR